MNTKNMALKEQLLGFIKMNINEEAERILRIGMKIREKDSFSKYEKAVKEIAQALEKWYETGKATRTYEMKQLLKQERENGYMEGEKDTHDNYKLGIYS